MNSNQEKIFGEGSNYYSEISDNVIKEIKNEKTSKIKFSFTDVNFFEKVLLENGIEVSMKLYWVETMQRIYLATISGYLRQYDWVQGINLAYNANNYNLFCAAVRSFMEASCDMYYSLAAIPLTVSSIAEPIKQAFAGELSEILISPEMEQSLLHFQEAKKRKKENDTPSYLYPETARTYLEHPHLRNLNLYKTYSELCEITHPAKQSLNIFLNEDNYEYSFIINSEANIAEFIKQNKYQLKELYMYTNNILILLLKTLNYFGADYYTKAVDTVNCETIPMWSKIRQSLQG